MKTDHRRLLEIASNAVELSVRMVKASTRHDIEVRSKGIRDICTSLDCSIEAAVRRTLAEMTPGVPLWGEESGRSFKAAERFWVLDPLDGTVNFVHGMPLYAVSLALIEDGVPVVGVIDLPAFGESFWAIKGEGAFCNEMTCRVSETKKPEEAIMCFGDPDVGPDARENNRNYEAFRRDLHSVVMRSRLIGSAALQLAWLAAGRIDISITWGNLPWDVQAGVLLVREAGGVVMDLDGATHSLDSKYTLACNANLAEFMKRKSASYIRDGETAHPKEEA